MRVEDASVRPPVAHPAEAPWTVKALALLTVLGYAFWVFFHWDGDVVRIVLPAILNFALVVGIIKGYRGAWAVAVFFAVLSVIGTVGIVQTWLAGASDDVAGEATSIFLYVCSTALLLHPLTRGWVRR